MWKKYINATNLDQVIDILDKFGDRSRILAGGTDLLLELERSDQMGVDILIDISRISGLDRVVLDDQNLIHIGPLVTHNHCVAWSASEAAGIGRQRPRALAVSHIQDIRRSLQGRLPPQLMIQLHL